MPLFLCFLGIALASSYGITILQLESSYRAYFVEGDPTVTDYDRLIDEFGTDEFVFLLFETDHAFTKDMIQMLRELRRDLEKLSFVDEVTTMVNASHIESTADGDLRVGELLPTTPQNSEEMNRFREKVTSHPFYKNKLVSEDGRQVGIMVKTHIDEEHPRSRSQIKRGVLDIIDGPKYQRFAMHAAGVPINWATYQESVEREMLKFLKLVFLVMLLLLLLLFRGLSGCVGPLLVVAGTLAVTFGTMGLTGIPMSMPSAILIVLLISVGTADSVHIISEYQIVYKTSRSKCEAYCRALSLTGFPCLLTTLTTVAGFLSLYASRVKPVKQFGLMGAYGIALALLFTFGMLPLVLSITAAPAHASRHRMRSLGATNSDEFWMRLLRRISFFAVNRRIEIVVVSLVLGGVAAWGLQDVNVESELARSYSPRHRFRQDLEYVDSHMGGSVYLSAIIDTGKPDGMKDPELLRALEKMQKEFTSAYPFVKSAFSVVDVIKEVNRVMHDNRKEYDAIPDSQTAVAQLLFVYEMSDADQLSELVTPDYRTGRVKFRSTTLKMTETRTFFADNIARQFIRPPSTVLLTGTPALVNRMSDYLTMTQIKSFALAFAVIFLMMFVVFRSARVAVLAMVPNLLPVLIASGTMGWLGIDLDVGTALVAAVAIGLVVDDTIHFTVRSETLFREGNDYATCLYRTSTECGRAIMFTSISLALAFSCSVFSDFVPVANFGFLSALVACVACCADLCLLPALLFLVKPFRRTGSCFTQRAAQERAES